MNSIVHLNTNDVRGGAAKVARRLAEAQMRRGYNASMLVGFRESDANWVQAFRLDRDLNSRCEEQGLLDYDLSGSDRLPDLPTVGQAELVHAHNLHGGYFNPHSLVRLSHAKPLVWTLHDMQAVTGHCTYSYDCTRWEIGCGECPNLEEPPALSVDSTRRLWRDKQEIYRQSVLYLVTPSLWLKRIVERSILGDHPVELIYNGVNTGVFYPQDRAEIRRKLGLPLDRVLIGCVANGGSLGNKRKGGGVIVQAIESLKAKGIPFLFVNIGQDAAFLNDDTVMNTGYIVNEHRMAEWYAAMDIFLFPSLADNCPLVVSEAMACGVPVVTFATGGIPELVEDGVHGAVVPYLDTAGLVQRLELLAGDEELRRRMSIKCREDAVRRFDHERIVDQYEKAYERAVQHHVQTMKTKDVRVFPAVVPHLKEPIVAVFAGEDCDPAARQTYRRLVRIAGPATSERVHEVDADLIWLPADDLETDSRFLETLIEQYRNEEVFYSDLYTFRDNGSFFYRTVSPVIREESGLLELDTVLKNAMLFERQFFAEHGEQILQGDVIRARRVAGLHAGLVKSSVKRYVTEKLKNRGVREFYIYGAGTHTVDLLRQLGNTRGMALGIFDQDERKAGQKLEGLTIYHANRIQDLPPAFILISSLAYERDIYRRLTGLMPGERVLRYYGEPN